MNKRLLIKHLLTAFGIFCGTASVLSAADWLHWRGPEQNGVSREKDLPERWSEDPADPENNLIWKAPFGSRSTPLVMGKRVYLINDVDTGANEQERVVCLDADSGKLLWEKRFNVFLVDIVSSRVGWTSPAGDAQTGYVYTHGTQGLLTCFDRDGNIIWQRSLTEECGRICGYGGRLSTPVVDGELVILGIINASFGDQAKGANRFLAVDKRTGKTVWWTDTGNPVNDTYYSTPVVANIAGQRLVISGGGDGYVHALKVRTGEKVWSHALSAKAINGSAVVHGNFVYVGNGEENFDNSSVQGQVVCLDGADVKAGRPKVVWKVDEIKAAFASPVVHDGRVYIPEEAGQLFCLDAATGKKLWKLRYGRQARGSPVWADGRIYIGEVNAHFCILKPGAKKCALLHQHTFLSSDPSAVLEVNGSPAIVNGRIYIASAEAFYCIGKKGHTTPPDPIPPATPEEKADPKAVPAKLLIYPADIVLAPGGTAELKVRAFDAQGRFLREIAAQWSLPAPPVAPKKKVAGPPIKGTVDGDGKLTVDAKMPKQHGPVVARAFGLEARGRIRVVPTLPYQEDFENVPEGGTPNGWVNVQGKFAVETKDGSKTLRKLTANPNPLLARANAYIGLPTDADYTVEADVMGGRVDKNLPDMGVLASRYHLILAGNSQQLRISSWDALPRIEKSIPWKWEPGIWYRMKLTTVIKDGKGIVRGKIWPRDQTEPDAWTVEVEDPRPNQAGAPGLYGYAVGVIENQLTPIWYDNIAVTPNKKQ